MSELRLPELPASVAAPPRYTIAVTPDTFVQDRLPDAHHDWRDDSGNVNLSLSRRGDAYLLAVPNLLQAQIDGAHVTLSTRLDATESDVRHSLLNQVLPRMLDRDGELMLHAALVADPGWPALLLVGETHYGKSTLAAAFAQSGARVFTDDGLCLSFDGPAVHAVPTYPNLRLRPDSRAALLGPVAPDHGHAEIHATQAVVGDPSPGAIVVLGAPNQDADISLQRVSIADAAVALVQNSYALDPTDLQRARKRLAQAAEVASRVPAFRLTYPRNFARLPEVLVRLRTLN